MGLFSRKEKKIENRKEETVNKNTTGVNAGEHNIKALNDKAVRAMKSGNFVGAIQLFESAAAAGDVTAMYSLALIYSNPKFSIFYSLEKAEKWSVEAAKRGAAVAMTFLVDLYSKNKMNNPKNRLFWMQKAAEAGVPDMMAELAIAYATADMGLSSDFVTAEKWALKAHAAGEKRAPELLKHIQSVLKSQEISRKINEAIEQERYDDAVTLLKPLADSGNADAKYQIACIYSKKQTILYDALAFMEFLGAAQTGQKDAFYRVALCYAVGRGVKQDYDKAEFWAKKAMDEGIEKSDTLFAIIAKEKTQNCFQAAVEAYEDGNLREAISLFENAYDSGIDIAAVNLAIIYGEENSEVYNMKQCAYWTRIAAEDGHGESMYNYALMLYNGDGVAPSVLLAEEWAVKAKNAGVEAADALLESLDLAVQDYFFDEGTQYLENGDIEGAVMYYELAAKRNNVLAARILSTLYARDEYGFNNDDKSFKW